MGIYDGLSKSVLIGLLKGKDKQISQLNVQCDNLNKEAGELTRKLNVYRDQFYAELEEKTELATECEEIKTQSEYLFERVKVERDMKNDYYARYKRQEERIKFLEEEIRRINEIAISVIEKDGK